MKMWVWTVVVVLITILIINVLKVPLWMFVILGAPLLAIVLTYTSLMYSFRASLRLEPIPKKGYVARIEELDKEGEVINRLGFDRKDAFYLKTIPDSITYVFKHNIEPIYLCVYHLGAKKTCDIVSCFERDFTLTTCSSVDGGMIPRPPKKMLQIFEKLSYGELLDKHRMAQDFIESKGIKQIDIPSEEFREYFVKSIREFAEYARTFAFWPVRLIYWTVIKRGKIYLKSIEEQYKEVGSGLDL